MREILTKETTILYSGRQLSYRAGITEAAPTAGTGFETLGLGVHYGNPEQVKKGERSIIIAPCSDEAWRELIERRDSSLKWIPADQLVPKGECLPFTDPLPVLFWGAGYEDGSKPFVERREDGTVIFYADILATTFFMLSRWEETVLPVRDLHGRFPATASVAYKQGFLDRPIVDEYALILQAWLKTLLPGWSPKPRPFSVKLSHDIDMVRSHNSLYWAWRAFAGDIVKRRRLRKARETFLSTINPGKDPIHRSIFDLADLSEKYGLKSAFYFMAADAAPNDAGYDPASPWVRKCIDELARRGHEIGFHPSYQASFDADVWQQEFARLSAATIGIPIAGGRQHFLRFRTPDTWRLWERAGLAYDSSVSYADHEGFRCGTCYPFQPFDVEQDRELKVTEIPLIIMDGTLRQYRGLTPEEGEARILTLAKRCKQVGGTFTLLWHNTSLMGEWTPWGQTYRRFLPLLMEKDKVYSAISRINS